MSRDLYSGTSTGPITGPEFLDQYAGHIDTLYRAVTFPLTAVAGVDAISATLDPPLGPAGLIDGMRFGISWPATNTSGMTLAINEGAPVPVLDADGGALIAGAVSAGLRSTLEYIGGAFRVQSPLLGGSGVTSARYFWQFIASGTWIKPLGLNPETMVFVEAWGGGGGGARSSGIPVFGGGGGAYMASRWRAGDLPAAVGVSIGAGGSGRTSNADGGHGGATTFGDLMTAYGGGGGGRDDNLFGGGGGAASAGATGVAGKLGGGIKAGGAALLLWGGAAGGSAILAGGDAIYGGGGGGGGGTSAFGSPIAPGGLSIFGGNGGAGGKDASATAGAAPGGGGGGAYNGNSGAGGRGEVRIWI